MSARLSRNTTVLLIIATLIAATLIVAGCGTSATTTTASITASTAAPTTVSSETTTTAAPTTSSESTTTTAAAVQNTKIHKIGIVAPEVAKDFGWNKQGVQGAKDLAASLNVPVVVNDGASYGDISQILRQLQQGGADFLIAFAAGYNTVGATVAQQLKVPTIVISAPNSGNVPGLSQDLETDGQDAGYLAGIAAAKTTKTKTVGIVISADEENFFKFSGGFAAGARATDPSIKILFAQVGQAAYADAAAAKRTAQSIIAGGADVVFGCGDGSSFGYIQAVESATPPSGADKVWFVDVIGDKTSLDTKGVLLTSAMFNFAPGFKEAADALNNGTFGQKSVYLTLENGGLGILQTKFISDAVWTEIQTAKADIISGKITVPVATTKAELDPIMKGQ